MWLAANEYLAFLFAVGDNFNNRPIISAVVQNILHFYPTTFSVSLGFDVLLKDTAECGQEFNQQPNDFSLNQSKHLTCNLFCCEGSHNNHMFLIYFVDFRTDINPNSSKRVQMKCNKGKGVRSVWLPVTMNSGKDENWERKSAKAKHNVNKTLTHYLIHEYLFPSSVDGWNYLDPYHMNINKSPNMHSGVDEKSNVCMYYIA